MRLEFYEKADLVGEVDLGTLTPPMVLVILAHETAESCKITLTRTVMVGLDKWCRFGKTDKHVAVKEILETIDPGNHPVVKVFQSEYLRSVSGDKSKYVPDKANPV